METPAVHQAVAVGLAPRHPFGLADPSVVNILGCSDLVADRPLDVTGEQVHKALAQWGAPGDYRPPLVRRAHDDLQAMSLRAHTRRGSRATKLMDDSAVVEPSQIGDTVMMTVSLRVPDLGDAGALCDLLTRNRSYFQAGEPLRPDDFYTEEGQRRVITGAHESRASGSALLFLIEEHGALVGRANLNGITRGALQSASVAYLVDERHAGRGIAQAALRALIRFAFVELNLHRLQAEVLETNVASRRVLTASGFVHYGTAPDYLRIQGRWQAHMLYQLTNPSWTEETYVS